MQAVFSLIFTKLSRTDPRQLNILGLNITGKESVMADKRNTPTNTYRPATQWVTQVQSAPAPTAEEIKRSFLRVINAAQNFAATTIATHSTLYETMQIAKPGLVKAKILTFEEADSLHNVAAFIRTLTERNPESALNEMKSRIEAIPTATANDKRSGIESVRKEFSALFELPFIKSFFYDNEDHDLSGDMKQTMRANLIEDSTVNNISVRTQNFTEISAKKGITSKSSPALKSLQGTSINIQQTLFSTSSERHLAGNQLIHAADQLQNLLNTYERANTPLR
jgi:hypothetical protein